MTKTAIAHYDRQSREDIATKDRAQREKESKRNAKVAVASALFKGAGTEVIKGLGRSAESSPIGTLRKIRSGAASTIGSKGLNHPEWYKKFIPSGVTTSLPTFCRIGISNLNLELTYDNNGTKIRERGAVPGIMAIRYYDWFPTGTQTSFVGKDPLNLSFKRMMSRIRAINSRIGDYEPSDLGMHQIASTQILKLIERLRVALNCYTLYRAENAYFSEVLITALGFNLADFKANYANYKVLLAKSIKDFNSNVALIGGNSYVDRARWLSTVIACDRASDVGQLYLFRPMYYYLMDNTETALEPQLSGTNLSYAGVNNFLTTAIGRMANSQGLVTMTADIRAGFADNLVLLPEYTTPSENDVVIIHDDHVLEQIHNLTTMPYAKDGNGLGGWTPYNNSLVLHATSSGDVWFGEVNAAGTPTALPRFSQANDQIASNISDFHQMMPDVVEMSKHAEFILNFYKDGVVEDDFLEATRLIHYYQINTESANLHTYVVRSSVTEVVYDLELFTFQPNMTVAASTLGTMNLVAGSQLEGIRQLETEALSFDWCPLLTTVMCDIGAATMFSSWITKDVLGEIGRYIPITEGSKNQIDIQCLSSMFYVDAPVKWKSY